jgi:threonine/homoserine/homoserine lactone efflux protein
MQFEHWLSLFAICLLGAMSPGPSLAVVMGAALRGSRNKGYGAALAHGLGVGLYALLTIAGLAVLVTQWPVAFVAMQLLGAAYLAYLGVKSLRQSSATSHATQAATGESYGPMSGFWIAFLNPKLAIFMLALFAQFLRPGADLMEKGIMVATVTATDASWYSLVVTLVSHSALRAGLEKHAGLIDRIFGVLLLVLAISVVLRALAGS